ncbi:flavin-containing monooxygenase [Sandaracinobacteroides saxicola]|uniref:NAD(P)/FAD-dependent oxidoreductase n=1 Tax=Sandaracinobacteroides saxicola TaxID=2759707 RepID=A0A7G5ILA4_9SPHN|nr:NAD(P)/FAD-dependent oxidoreductase [Sandaracinobacteroides saxicola]QMW24146.1 NAD(P)/FAD-dependent oxidoreductase [Sandaracinobacteroides saxicola]
MVETLDVLIVGAGISGIGTAWHLQKYCPGKRFALLEMRDSIGGTWDLFRYPGIRSDSDMHTLGYRFRPWTKAKAIADGPSIMEYLNEAVDDYGIRDRIRYRHKAVKAEWSSADAHWLVTVETPEGTRQIAANFISMCSGYYNYSKPYRPEFPGETAFRGRIVHPQFWTPDIDYAGKRVVVIGSGATAVTLVPEMAKTAAHVTMLQRSPTYVVSRPAADRIANGLRRVLPEMAAYTITRWKNVLAQLFFFKLARSRPAKVKEKMIEMVRAELPGHDVATHFTPRYNPWDQRVCLVPDADLFESLRAGTSSVVTDTIERFTETGIALSSGKVLEADLIVTATGLDLQLMSDIELVIDGRPHDITTSMQYKAMMYSDVPNLANTFGYTNASWTLKADLTAEYVCRLINHMDKTGMRQCTPRVTDASVTEVPFLDFSSGYVTRAMHKFPRQGSKKPWRVDQNYAVDMLALRYGKLEDGAMIFSNPAGGVTLPQPEWEPVAAAAE